MERQLPIGAGCQVERPDLRQARTAQMEQRSSVAGKCRCGGGADSDEGFRGVLHGGLGNHTGIEFARTMRRVVLANETDWDGWRKATRSLVLAGVAPDEVRWG